MTGRKEKDPLLSLKGDELQGLSRLPDFNPRHDLICIYAAMILDQEMGIACYLEGMTRRGYNVVKSGKKKYK